MADEKKLMVTVKTADVGRLIRRIATLDEVEDVEEHEEVDTDSGVIAGWPEFDMLVKCGHGARKSNVEELLLGVKGVEVRLLK